MLGIVCRRSDRRSPSARLFIGGLALLLVSLTLPTATYAYNCGGSLWQTITVTPSNGITSNSDTYVITTRVPNLSGCDLNTSSVISIVLPGDTNAGTISSGTLNGNAITFNLKAGQSVTFNSPGSLAYNQAVTIILNGITNPSTQGSKTLLMSASPAQNGSVGQTVSSAYMITFVPATPTNTATISATPTRSTSPTMTPTLTPTPTRTPTVTPTGGLCSSSIGNNPCVPGGGAKRTDCAMEWITKPPPLPGRGGILKTRLICYEGDPICDIDPILNNKSCTFDVRLCINNHDPRLTTCTPLNLIGFEVRSPRPLRPRDAADSANTTILETQAGPTGFGVPVKRGKTVVSNGQANVAPDLCSPHFPIVVPLRTTNSGRVVRLAKKLRITGTTSATKDTDGLALECRPSTCGDHVMQGNESCDDGNRLNGDGCNQGCQLEPPTPTPAEPSHTPTEVPTAGPPTLTPTTTATPSITPTSPPMLLHRVCNFRSGTRAFIQGKTLGAQVALTGFQGWDFDIEGANGLRSLVVPQSGTHFDPAGLPFGIGTLCARLAEDGAGTIDCDGGAADYDILVEQDHNTSSAPPPGFAQDPECDDSVVNPFFGAASASLESATDLHPGVCNSPVHVNLTGSFAAGGMKLTEHLFIRLITSGSCPADGSPFDSMGGDIDITGSISTGTAKGVIYNVNNIGAATMGTTGAGNGPSICGAIGTAPCTTQIVGTPFGCASIDANDLSAGKLGFAFTVLDLDFVGDGIATLTIQCQ